MTTPRGPGQLCAALGMASWLVLVAACARSPAIGVAEHSAAAVLELQKGNLKAARVGWRSAVSSAGDAATWKSRLAQLEAELLIAEGDSTRAVETLRAAPQEPGLNLKREILLAQACLKLSLTDEARAHLERASTMAANVQSPTLQAELDTQWGTYFSRTGNMAGAERSHQAALRSALGQNDLYLQAAALNNLGMIRMRIFRFDEALSYFQRALAASERHGAQLFSAAARGNMASCYYRLGDFDKALSVRSRVLSDQEKLGSLETVQRSLGEIGNIHLLRGDAREAVAYFQRALDLASRQNVTADSSRWAGNLAVALTELRDWTGAEQANRESWRLKRLTRERRSEIYPKLTSAVIAAGRGSYGEAKQILAEVLVEGSHNPAVLWDAHATLAGIHVKLGERALASAHFEKAIALVEADRASVLRSEYRISYLSGLIRFYHEYVDWLVDQGEHRRALEVAESSRARILMERNGSAERSAPVLTAAAKLAAPRGSAALVYWVAPKRSFLWVVEGSSPRLFLLPAESEIRNLVNAHEKLIGSLRDPLREESFASQELFRHLVQPALSSLARSTKVVLIPDGPLHGLNFDTLPVPSPAPHYWIEDVEVTVSPSLRMAAGSDALPNKLNNVLLIGDPQPFEDEYPKLRYAAAEIASIRSHMDGETSRVITGADARPAVFRAAAPHRFDMIHFTAHAEANRESPLDSAVILSPGGTYPKLYARDILDIPLNATLVTLSACRSAGARTFAGEGLVGFVWAFLRAGAQNVIAGLWDVNDSSTAALMDGLYARLSRGDSPASALRGAKLSLLGSSGNFRKPYYWAPFQIYSARRGR